MKTPPSSPVTVQITRVYETASLIRRPFLLLTTKGNCRKPIAVLLVCVGLLVVIPTQIGAAKTDATDSALSGACTPIKVVYSEKNWRDAKPQSGVNVCFAPRAARKATTGHFYDYRHYRQIATMRCKPGSEGYSCPTQEAAQRSPVSPDLIVGRVTMPLSGLTACISYSGMGQPWPIRGFHDRLMHHQIAATLSRGAWVSLERPQIRLSEQVNEVEQRNSNMPRLTALAERDDGDFTRCAFRLRLS